MRKHIRNLAWFCIAELGFNLVTEKKKNLDFDLGFFLYAN